MGCSRLLLLPSASLSLSRIWRRSRPACSPPNGLIPHRYTIWVQPIYKKSCPTFWLGTRMGRLKTKFSDVCCWFFFSHRLAFLFAFVLFYIIGAYSMVRNSCVTILCSMISGAGYIPKKVSTITIQKTNNKIITNQSKNPRDAKSCGSELWTHPQCRSYVPQKEILPVVGLLLFNFFGAH